MRIVHLADSFSPLSETFIYDYITQLQRSGVDNHVVTFRCDNIEERPFENVYPIRLPSRWHPERAWGKVKRHLHLSTAEQIHQNMCNSRFSSLVKRLKPDVIHAHFGPMGVLMAPVARTHQIPLVVTFYGYDISSLPKDSAWRKRYQLLFESMSCATVLSQDMLRCITELGAPAEKVKVVHLGKQLNYYSYRKPCTPPKNWISVGRLVEKKGHLDCIKAFQLVAKDVDCTLTIIGDGELLPGLREYVQQNGLSHCVYLKGGQPHHEVKQLLAQADAFILCSKVAASGDSEGTPTVLMEAQALGLPCVSTWHSGIPEVIPAENHWLLAKEGNIDDIAKCIRKLMACSAQQLETISRFGRSKVENEFNLIKEAGKLIEMYCAV